ncbi:MAG: 50S ribosomal protein L30 [Deltaproteobacteria bacterium CG2_30_63_29]|nr:MAG: 50S ribosomal protein L30 [Deltaproteobacteria bacterium CG2_30_63_29]PIW02132.1 MAG: 50S ribosomal protein L30 [Deltaproteobacteria bacterium CG17_big_fil_post_rev_8_21_14_2_50_63_7]PJB35134.1 MAG: 50S ribosomal protein L30 [Deltaproteobacteria bacterium CG_4_9_14_3_um_filter_63_12]
MSKLKITRTRGDIGKTARQRATMRHLGLRRIGSTVTQDDSKVVRGMIAKVSHMVSVEDVE